MAIVSLDSDSDFSVKVFHQPGIVVVDFWAPCADRARWFIPKSDKRLLALAMPSVSYRSTLTITAHLLKNMKSWPFRRYCFLKTVNRLNESLVTLHDPKSVTSWQPWYQNAGLAGFDNKNIGMI